jgi:hypothetical protein
LLAQQVQLTFCLLAVGLHRVRVWTEFSKPALYITELFLDSPERFAIFSRAPLNHAS